MMPNRLYILTSRDLPEVEINVTTAGVTSVRLKSGPSDLMEPSVIWSWLRQNAEGRQLLSSVASDSYNSTKQGYKRLKVAVLAFFTYKWLLRPFIR